MQTISHYTNRVTLSKFEKIVLHHFLRLNNFSDGIYDYNEFLSGFKFEMTQINDVKSLFRSNVIHSYHRFFNFSSKNTIFKGYCISVLHTRRVQPKKMSMWKYWKELFLFSFSSIYRDNHRFINRLPTTFAQSSESGLSYNKSDPRVWICFCQTIFRPQISLSGRGRRIHAYTGLSHGRR